MENSQPDWSAILAEAVSKPGLIHDCYSRFHNYSVGNQFLAMIQSINRGIPLGPINTFRGWQGLGRQVRKGEKAIELLMPVTVKRRDNDKDDERFTIFASKRHWFFLSQTDGEEFTPPPVPGWNRERALSELGIEVVSFDVTDGNAQGVARGRTVAVSPLAALPHRTLFHEMAHVILGHTAERLADPANREVEAEAVALICCESLELDGAAYSRGYLQAWLGDRKEIPAKNAQRAMSAATKILKAGREES